MKWFSFFKKKKPEEPKSAVRHGTYVFQDSDGKTWTLTVEEVKDLNNGYSEVRYIGGGNSRMYADLPSILPGCFITWTN